MSKSDLELTSDLCREEGVLGPSLQKRYGVVRKGKETWVAWHALTSDERHVIIEELDRRVQTAWAALAAAYEIQKTPSIPEADSVAPMV